MAENSDLTEAIEKRKARPVKRDPWHYVRFHDDWKGMRRGSAVFEKRVVHGYPRIGRILALGSGLQEHFSSGFWAEEKVDGYNVRIFRLQGQHLAMTRGGFLCPFTTDRLPDLLDLSIFDAEPDLVICAEVAGPDNPYNESCPTFIANDIRLFVFDLMRQDNPGFLPRAQTYELIDHYRLPSVHRFGRFTAVDVGAVQEILHRLNQEHREGLVFKEDPDGVKRTKYVTTNANISDIRSTVENILELPPHYFTNRILRLVLSVHEQGIAHSDELDRQLGAAFLDGLLETVHQFKREQKVYHRYRCRFRERRNADAMLEHLRHLGGRKAHIQLRQLRHEGGYWVLEYDRIYPSLNGVLRNILGGGMVYD